MPLYTYPCTVCGKPQKLARFVRKHPENVGMSPVHLWPSDKIATQGWPDRQHQSVA